MRLSPEPVEIGLTPDGRALRVAWDDEHDSTYELRYLRGFCPCAACQGHGAGTWTFVQNDGPTITEIGEVGNYAISLRWSDGHTTGIYSWETLRELCPCHNCRTDAGVKHPMSRYPAAS